MAAANAIEFTFTAKDLASPTIEKLRNELKLFGPSGQVLVDMTKNVEGATNALDAGLNRVTRSLRSLVVPLATEVAPAFGAVTGQITQVIASATALSGGWASLGIVATGLAAIVGGQLAGAWQKQRQAMEDFATTQRSVNFDVIAKGVADERAEIEKLTKALEDLQEQQKAFAAFQGPAFLAPRSLQPEIDELLKRRGRFQENARRQGAFISGREASALERGQYEIAPGATEGADAYGMETRRRIADIQRQVIEIGILDPVERAFAAAIRQADAALLSGQGPEAAGLAGRMRALAAAARAEAITQRRLGFQAIGIEGIEDYGRSEGLGAGVPLSTTDLRGVSEGGFEHLRRLFYGREAAPEEGIEDAGRSEGGAIGDVTAFAAARKAVSDADLRDAERLRDAGVAYARVLEQQSGLTRDQQLSMSLVRIDVEANAVTSNQSLTVEEQRVRLFTLEAEAANRIRENFERIDAGAGLEAGFRDVADIVQSAGARMRSEVLGAFHDINQGFADIVVAGITGQSGKLADIGKRMGESLLRGIVEQFTTKLTGSIFSGVGSLFSSGTPTTRGVVGAVGLGGGVAGTLVAPSGVAAGTLVPLGGGGVGVVSATGTVMPVAGGGAGGGAGAGFGGGFSGLLGSSPVSLYDAAIAYSQFGAEGVAALQSGQAIVSGGELIISPLALETAGAGGLGSSASGAGALAGPILGGALAAVALGFGTYSALTSARTTTDVAVNALSGAVSGAILGGTIGSIFPGIGTVVGGVVGAVAGAAIQGGAAGIGKSENQPGGVRTGLKSFEAGEKGRVELKNAIDDARSITDIVAIFNKQWAPHGEVQVFVRPAPGGGIWWAGDYDDPSTHIFVEDDFNDPEVVANVHVWVGAGGATKEDRNLTEYLKQRILELLGEDARALIAYEEMFDRPGVLGTRVSRLTVLPSTRLKEAEGQKILFSRDQFDFAQYDEDQIEQLMRKMARVSRDRSLGFVDAEHLIF